MSIDRALNLLHAALWDEFASLAASQQSDIIIVLEDLVDKLASITEQPTRKEASLCPTPPADQEKP